MKHVLRTTALSLVVTLILGCAYLAVDMFLFGRIDPKWGGPWENFQLGVYLLVIATAVEAAAFLLFGLVAGRRALIPSRSKVIAAVAMAVATILLWPPKATSPVITACLVSALALLAGSVTTWLSGRSAAALAEKEHAVTGA